MIPVTKPFLPPREEFDLYIDKIWERNHLTNNGPLVRTLESRVKNYLNSNDFLYLSNGTVSLQIAIKALGLKGEIITTPFSYVASTSSIVWENCKPIFADIKPDSFNISPEHIENAITKRTSAILATHVFGNPCEIDDIETLASKYGLKVIYDGAHCFGTRYRNQSIFNYGDITTLSCHATKLFHTIEGGGVFTQDLTLFKKMSYIRNFGHNGQEAFFGLGINGKNSEVHAAMGLANLKYADDILLNRKSQFELYKKELQQSDLVFQKINVQADYNYAYFPILTKNESACQELKKLCEENDIFPRRYFYPSLDSLPYLDSKQLITSNNIAKRILCLPLYHSLKDESIRMISKLLVDQHKYVKLPPSVGQI